jgi:hypothetical protein
VFNDDSRAGWRRRGTSTAEMMAGRCEQLGVAASVTVHAREGYVIDKGDDQGQPAAQVDPLTALR